MLDRIAFLIGEALMALRRNGWMTFAAVSTVAVSLLLVGGLGYGYIKIDQFAKKIGGSFEIRAFMVDGATRETISATANKIRGLNGVKTVNWIPKEKAWEKMQKELGNKYTDVENPLPDTFKIMLTDLNKGPQVESALKIIPEIQDVAYQGGVQDFLSKIQFVIKWIGLTLVILLVATSGVLIFNAIRLTIVARRREIRIMQLVGAPYLMVRIPFLIEGTLQGLTGGLLATFILWPCYAYISGWILSTYQAIPEPFPLWSMLSLLSLLGGTYGLICSALAVAGPMKVESRGSV